MAIRRGLRQVRACRRLQAGALSLGLACGLALTAASSAAAAPPLGGTWQPIGPSGGQITALAVDPHRPATIYAGTVGGGLYRSDDFGRSWSARGLSSWIYVNSVTVDPVVSDTVYAGIENSSHANGDLWKSPDGGSSWQAAGAGLPPAYGGVSALVIDPLTPSTLYAVSEGGLWKSVDGARSWAALPFPLESPYPSARTLAIDPHSPAILYAGSDTGLFKSGDGGATWAPAVRLHNLAVTSIVVDPVLPRRLYAGTARAVAPDGSPSNRPTLFVSTDRGGTWHPANGGLSPCSQCLASFQKSVLSLALSPAAHLTVYAGTYEGVWKSTNGGGSWAPANAGLADVVVWDLAADPRTSGRLYAGVSSYPSYGALGVWKTANGGATWRSASAGIDSSEVSALVADPSGTGILYAAVPGSGVVKRQGSDWQPANQGLMGTQVSALVIDPRQPQTLYAETEAGFWKTVDGAASWSQPSPGTAVAAPPLLIDPQTPTTLYAMGGVTSPGHVITFQKSVDGGVTWSLLPVGVPTGDAAIAPSAPLNLYWVFSITFYHPVSFIAHSPDGGLSIEGELSGQGFAALGPLVVDPQDPATVYAFANVGPIFPVSYDSVALVKSTDSGHLFTELNCPCQPLFFAPGPPQTLYAAAGGAIVASSDGGASWTPVGDPLPAGAGIASMAFDPSSQTLFVATNNRGVYQLMP
jgi:photosystem II stability/assembly factor-like uncharacterized protein